MSDQKRDPNPQPADIIPRPAAQPINVRPLAYPEVELLRYENSTDLNLRALLRTIRKRRLLILGITVIITAFVTIEVFRTKDLYQATATIEIGRDSGSGARVSSNEVFIQSEDDLIVTMNTAEVAIKSIPLLEDVVARLQLDRDPTFLDVTQKKSLMESFQEIAGRIQRDKKAPPAVFTSSPVKTKMSGARSPEESERLAPFAGILEGSLRVRPIRDTRDMTVTYTHTDPVLAASIANAIAGRFVESSFDKKVEGVTSASEWLDRSTRELKAKVEHSEQALADYTKSHNIYAVDGKATLITENLTRLHDQAMRAETDRILKESIYQQVVQGRVDQIPESFADPQTSALQKKLGELEVSAAELKVTYGPKYSKLAETNEQIDVIREQISTSRILLSGKLRADYDRALSDERALKAALDRAKAEATKENQGAIQYSLIKQDVDTAKSLYTEFLQKTNQANLEVAQQSTNIRVVAPARKPNGPVSPNRPRTILMALLVALTGGIGLAWLLDRLDDTIRTIEDVTRYTQLPTLAMIPAMSAGRLLKGLKNSESVQPTLPLATGAKSPIEIQRGRLMEFDSKAPVAEAYRALRTGLLLSAVGKAPKIVLVTSVRMGDGKTTTASNVAISLAQVGASVLLMDCDLRKSTTHDMFGIPNNPGLSSYLAQSKDIESITYESQVPNLSLIPAGPTPPNPSELLSSEGMKRLLDQLSERYDHIVIDSPPIGSVTDAVVLSTIVDGVILVIHGGKNSRQAVQRACHELTAVGARTFGIVLNNVDLRREGYDDYSYYAYSYTDNGKRSKIKA